MHGDAKGEFVTGLDEGLAVGMAVVGGSVLGAADGLVVGDGVEPKQHLMLASPGHKPETLVVVQLAMSLHTPGVPPLTHACAGAQHNVLDGAQVAELYGNSPLRHPPRHDPVKPRYVHDVATGEAVVGDRVVGRFVGCGVVGDDVAFTQHLMRELPGHKPEYVVPVHRETSTHLPCDAPPSGVHEGDGAQHTVPGTVQLVEE